MRVVSFVLGPFRLTGLLGQGGAGQVWSAVHERQALPVAVKVVGGSVDRLAEVRALAALDHPNLMMVFDHGEVPATVDDPRVAPGSAWIAMELCSGGSLARAAPRNWNQLRRVAQQLMSGLAYAHARGVLHRDLTPGNVLIASSGDVRPGLKLGDFGLAGHRGAAAVTGTPGFMAPEQFTGDVAAHGPWTDLYGLGCLLWTLVSGDAPFGTARPPEVLAAAHAELDPPPLRPRFDVPPGFEVLLRALLEKRPEARVRSAAEALDAFDAVDGQAPRGVPADWRAAGARRPAMRLIGAGLGLHAFRPVPLIGRDAERDRLWAALVAVRADGALRVVHVTGPAGIGADALVRWLAERALETGAARVATVDPRGRERPEPGVIGALADALAAAWPTPPGDRADAAPVRAAPSEAQRLMALAALVAELRRHGPLLLHLRADAADAPAVRRLLAVMAAVTPEGAGAGVLVVVTSRAGAPADALALGPLSPAHQVHLIEGALGLSGSIAERIRVQSAGNPGYAVACMADRMARGALAATDAGFTAVGGDDPLPVGLPALWAARLAGVRAADPDALVLAGLLGPVVPRAVWARVGADPAVWDRLEADALAAPSGDGWAWTRRQAMDAARVGAPAALHARCAAALTGVDDPRAAEHRLAAGQPEAAAAVALPAARAALRADPLDAVAIVALGRRALAAAGVPAADPRWGEAAVVELRAWVDLGDWAQAGPPAEALLRAARAYGWDSRLAPAQVACAEVALGSGRADVADAHLLEALAVCRRRGDDHGAARALLVQGRVALTQGRFDEAARRLQQAQALFSRLGNAAGAGACLVHRAEVARHGGQVALAGELLGQARAALQRTPHVVGGALVELIDADLALDAGRTAEATQGYAHALRVFEVVGAGGLAARALCGLGRAAASPTEARGWFDRACAQARGAQDRAAEATALAGRVLAAAQEAAGDAAARPALDAALAEALPALRRCAPADARTLLRAAGVGVPEGASA